MRKEVFRLIRRINISFCLRPLPTRVALYFHALEKSNHDSFSAMIGFFADQGYRFVDIDGFLAEGDGKRIYLSFDDNYQSWHQSLPLLQKLRINATFYVNTLPLRDSASTEEVRSYYERINHAGDRQPLSRHELKDILAAGHTLGSHTHSHSMLTSLELEMAKDEILRGKTMLEDILGQQVLHFSYPYGMRRHFNEALRNYCVEIGFRTIADAIPCLQYAQQNCMNINRSPWRFDESLEYNVVNIRIDGRFFEYVSGRSAAG